MSSCLNARSRSPGNLTKDSSEPTRTRSAASIRPDEAALDGWILERASTAACVIHQSLFGSFGSLAGGSDADAHADADSKLPSLSGWYGTDTDGTVRYGWRLRHYSGENL